MLSLRLPVNSRLLSKSKAICGASLVVEWFRICLPMQETRVQSLVQEDPTCHQATKPVCRNYWACALGPGGGVAAPEPMRCSHWSPRALEPLKPTCPRASALQQEKPPQRAARHCHEEEPPLAATRKSLTSNEDPAILKVMYGLPTERCQHPNPHCCSRVNCTEKYKNVTNCNMV